MSKFCSQCGSMMEDSQMFCGVCGTQVADITPQQAAPQYVAPQQAAPQYVAPQQAAPQYVAPQYAAPQKPSTPGLFSNMDWMGMLTGKAPMFQNCLASLAVQFISFVLFFLPMISIGSGRFKDSYGLFMAMRGMIGIVVPILAILILLGSIAFLLLPLLQKKEIQPLNVLVFFAGQIVYFLSTVITVVILLLKFRRCSITAGFILYALFTLAAMFFVARILFFKRNEVMAIFKKPQPVNNYAPNGYPNYQGAQPVNNYVGNNYSAPNAPVAPQADNYSAPNAPVAPQADNYSAPNAPVAPQADNNYMN